MTGRADPGWAFPRGKPQLFARTPRQLSRAVLFYAFGRRLPVGVQRGLAALVRVPLLRSLVAERRPLVEPVCGWETVDAITARLVPPPEARTADWIHLGSQWDKQRCSMIRLSSRRSPAVFVTVERGDRSIREPSQPMPSCRVPRCLDTFTAGDWVVRRYELLPALHRPASCDVARIRQVAAEVSAALKDVVERPADAPAHWQPIHGDLVPWNLREDARGALWLLDWEDAGWGPPLADVVRYLVARESLDGATADRIAAAVRGALPDVSCDVLQETAAFWLRHRNFRPALTTRHQPQANARDAGRWAREGAAFQRLAGLATRGVP